MSIHFEETSLKPGSEDVVETTSVVAAKAMARYYMHQNASELENGDPHWDDADLLENSPYITRRTDEAGRTVYCIRPLPAGEPSDSLNGRRHSYSTERKTLTLFQSSLKKKGSKGKSLRYARSNPQLRSLGTQPKHLFADDRGYFRPTASAEDVSETKDPLHFLTSPPRQFQHHILTPSPHSSTPASVLQLGSRRSRSSSVPKLSETSLDNLNARGVIPFGAGSVEGSLHTTDVLGNLLGWSDPSLRPKASVSTLLGSLSRSQTRATSSARPKHVSGMSYSSSAEGGDESSQTGGPTCIGSQRDSQTVPLPSDLQEELISEQPYGASPPDSSTGPSTPTLTTANFRSLHHFPSNESNTIRFDPSITSGQTHSSNNTPASPSRSPPQTSQVATRSPTSPQAQSRAKPFGHGVKLDNKTLKRIKPTQPSESMSAFETSLADLTQEVQDGPRPRFEDPVLFDFLQTLEQHSELFRYHQTGSTLSRDSLSGPLPQPHGSKGSWQRHARTGSTTSLLSQSSETSSLRLNAQRITVSAAPNDDPRFVMWGEQKPDASVTTAADGPPETGIPSASHSSSPPSSNSTHPKRWSRKASVSSHDLSTSKSQQQGGATSRCPTAAPAQKVLMAATVERWVAELTSKIDPELLADFFLTYRFFLTPLSLCQLLITRFDWALAVSDSPEDEAARRIVRVRSFVVIRHWLLNYFVEDFVPDSNLRGRLTGWLNATAKLPSVKASPSDQRLLKNLKKVVRRLKEQYASIGTSLEQGAAQLSAALATRASFEDHARAQSPLHGPAIVLDEDVDLNFDTYNNAQGASHQWTTGSHSHRGTEGMLLPVSPPKDRRMSGGFVGYSHEATQERAPNGKLARPHQGSSPTRSPHSSSPANPSLPLNHSPVSRAVTSTLGQFGRFKRMLQNRTGHGLSPGSPAQYPHEPAEGDVFSTPESSQTSQWSPSFELSASASPTSSSGLDTPSDDTRVTCDTTHTSDEEAVSGLGIRAVSDQHEEQGLRHTLSSQTIKSQNRTSRDKPRVSRMAADPTANMFLSDHSLDISPNHRTSVVQLDDVGLSDDSDVDEVELPRTLRRLPAARDLRQAETLRRLAPQASRATMSSFATTKSSKLFHRPSFASFVSRSSNHSQSSAEEAPQGVINNFVVEGLEDSDDDEEPGDVEAALRRLEGQIDDGRQKAKAERVERQMAKSKAAVSSRSGLHAQAESEDEEGERVEESTSPRSSSMSDRHAMSDADSAPIDEEPVVLQPPAPSPDLSTLRSAQPTPEPIERPSSRLSLSMLQERVPKTRLSSIRQSMSRKPSIRNLLSRPPQETDQQQSAPSRAAKLSVPPSLQMPYRSFVLLYKTEALAQQFCLIERDLLSNIGWHELIHGVWRRRDAQLDVLDWEQYIKSRARQLVEARDQGKQLDTTEVYAAIARFNLVANWVASEILMTSALAERVTLIEKFIRIAWKCYRQSNFQTLTQIVHGLQSIYVERLGETWRRVQKWETRVFRDFKAFTSHARNFRTLRTATDALAKEWGPPGQTSVGLASEAPSTSSGGKRASTSGARNSKATFAGCIPFLGLFLRDLSISNELPTFLDATSPTTPASVDPSTNQLTVVADPEAFSDLPSIPQSYLLYPLVNVHKARTISGIVQKVLVFQEMAGCYPFEAEPMLFRKCLALQCLPVERQRVQSFKLEG